jgi:hypothetical protein
MSVMRVDSRFLGWGVFLVFLGGVPLAVQQGWLSESAVSGAWRFWPLILIGIGVGLILRRTPIHFLGGLIVAATFGLLFGSLLATAANGGVGFGCVSGRSGTAFTTTTGTFAGDGSVAIEMSCGELKVNAAPGRTWTVSGRSSDGQVPVKTTQADRIELRAPSRSWWGPFGDQKSEDWTVVLPTDPAIALDATLNAGSASLDLSGAHLSRLSMTTNAGDTTIDLEGATVPSLSYTLNAGSGRITLPSASMTGSATVNAGSLELCVPSGAGLRIESSSTLGSNDFAEKGLVQTGSTWTTPTYGSSAVHIDLSLTANAGSIELDPVGGCR